LVDPAIMAVNRVRRKDPNKSKKMLRVLLVFLAIFAAIVGAWAVSPAGHFQQRLLDLQRQGSCRELPQFGVGTHQGRNPDGVNLRLASEIQAKIVRIDVSWAGLEQNGQFDFAPFETLINGLRGSGKSIILVLAYGHPDYSDGRAANGFPLPPNKTEQIAAYGHYAQAVARRFHGPDIVYEIWNEPNLDLYWPPVSDAAAYGELLAEATRLIREVEPNATILPAGLANENNPALFLHSLAMAGALDHVDGLNFHPYRFEGPENSLYDISEIESAATEHADRPLWITEWGYSESWLAKRGQDPRRRQAILIARLMLTAALAKAKAVLIYDLIDDGQDASNPEANFGLYDYDFQPKPAAAAFRTLGELMSKCDHYEFTSDLKREIMTATFSDKSNASHVIWTYRPGHAQNYCFDPGQPQQPDVMDIFGNHFPLTACEARPGSSLPISDSLGPIILTTKSAN
jgi:polysaccharide biosynthesis protein PslG